MSTATMQVFRLPDLGEGLTEAGLVQWLVAIGDTIVTDQAVAEVETAKSVVELPSPFAGVVTARHGAPGDTIDVGAPLLEVETAMPSAPASGDDDNASRESESPHDAYRAEERAGSGNVLIGYGTTAQRTSGRRRRATGRSAGAGTQIPSGASVGHGPVAVRSPLVRRLARDLGLDVRTIAPTGADGAITRADVLRAAVDHAVDGVGATTAASQASTPAAASTTDAAAVDDLAVRARTRMSPLRRAANATLSRSRAEIPEATVWVDVDATALWEARRDMAPDGTRAPSLTALLARFALLALADHPLLAARLSPDADEIIEFDGVNLGVATDTPRGLMVPVVPRAHVLSVARLDAALRELAETARAGTMPPARLRGSTFTLNNYGGFGVDGSAAIINHPDVAVLGVGRILERPWVVDGAIVPRRIVQLSLVFDHRVCDGGYAASFLRQVTTLIEHPLRAYPSL